MIDSKFIKPIPQYILKKIKKIDLKLDGFGNVKFYAYLSKMKGELVKITVACKKHKEQWFCKQVAVHGIHSKYCLVRDMDYSYLGGYTVGWFQNGLSNFIKRFDDGRWYQADDKYYDPFAVVVNKSYALKLDEYKYSAIDKYNNSDLLKYLRIYEEYPQVEYFVKLGLTHLVKSKTVLKEVGKNKAFRKWLVRYAKILRNDLGNYPYFNSKDILRAFRQNMPLIIEKEMERKERMIKQDYFFKNTISDVIKGDEIFNFIKYKEENNISLSSYADYVQACKNLNLDMTLPKNLYPHDFKRWHDIRIDEYNTLKAMQDEQERKEFYEKFTSVAQKYLPLQRKRENTFIVVIAKSPQELIREGRILHHCVGSMNYDQKFIREESLIFFVRNFNEPNTPFVTMEYSPLYKDILQCHGENNRKPSQDVLDFVYTKWLPYANRKLNKIVA